jgi:hypothetical protein
LTAFSLTHRSRLRAQDGHRLARQAAAVEQADGFVLNRGAVL